MRSEVVSLSPPSNQIFSSHHSVEEDRVALLNKDGFDHGRVRDEHHGYSSLIDPCHTTPGRQL